MENNEEMYRLLGRNARIQARASGFLGKVLTFATGAVLLVVGLMFSLLVLAVAATAAMLVLGYLWWKTREARRQIREQPPAGRIIDGEVIRDSVKQESDRTRAAY